MIFLERIDGVPIAGNDKLTYELQRWVVTMADAINTNMQTIEPLIYDPVTIAGITQTALTNTRYIPTNIALTSITLPETCFVGDVVSIRGEGSGGWSLLPASGQTIQLLGMTAGTSIASADRYDSIDVTCVVEGTTWICNAYVSSGLVIT